MIKNNSIIRIKKTLEIYVFLMTSSFLMLFGINLSFFIFFKLLFNLRNYIINEIFSKMNWIKISVYFFIFGSILSVLGTIIKSDFTAFKNSINVLPNYLYWSFIIFITQVLIRRKLVDFNSIIRYIFYGVIFSSIYYIILQDFLANKYFFKKFGPNNFSFLLICLMPFTLYYLKENFSKIVAYLFLILILYWQLSEGRRAGFFLVSISGILVLNIQLFNIFRINKIFRTIVSILIILFLYKSEPIEDLIYNYSPRIHQILYKQHLLNEDRSFQTRLAMVEKGLSLFKDNPFTGIGLNNFAQKDAQIDGNFIGSKFVIKKNIFQGTSSHNSYINILAEGGFFLFFPFLILFLGVFITFLRNFFKLSEVSKVAFLSFFSMCIHLYFMNAIVNSLAWFNLSLAIIASKNFKRIR